MRHCLRNIRLIALLLPLTGWIASKGPHSKVDSSDRAESSTEASVSIRGLEKPDHAAQGRVTEAYGKLPLSFEANRGQMDSEVKFFSRGSGYGIFISPTEAVLSLSRGLPQKTKGPEAEENLAAPSLHEEAEAPQQRAVLRMKLVGANPKPQLTGEEELPGKVNYFIGNDPKKWRTNISTYAKVKYREVYPGIDLVHYGNQRQLEYDFLVAPGTDPKAIRLGFEGAETMEIDARGDLLLHTPEGDVRQHKPVIYQEFDGTRTQVSGGYSLSRRNQVSFELGKYDPGRPLIIDPTLSYSTYLGGNADDTPYGIAVDPAGNVYVSGYTSSTNFPTASAFQATYGGGLYDAFVTKLNATGSAILYSTYLGGNGDDRGSRIAVDSAGNAYVTGQTASTNFPTANPLQAGYGGGSYDAFVTKLNTSGSALVYSTYFGDIGDDRGHGIAVDSAGNAYVTGRTSSPNYEPPSPIQGSYGGGNYDALVIKLNATGSAAVYFTYLGGNDDDRGYGIAVDSAGNAYVTGRTASTNFRTASPFQGSYGGGLYDAFVTKLNATGSALVYSTYLGGSGDDSGIAIAVDPAGNAYVTGPTLSANFPTASPFQSATGANGDAFVTKLNATGSALVYSTYLGGNADDEGLAIAVDSTGNAYVTGHTHSSNFPTASPFQAATGANLDAFVTKLNATGSALVYSTYLGGNADDSGLAIAVDPAGNAYVTGATVSANFPTANPFQATYGGGPYDAFVAKIGDSAAGPSITSLIPPSMPAGNPGFVLTVNGANFVNGSQVLWSGSSRTTTFLTSTQVTAAILAADIASPGTRSVTVSNPDGFISNVLTFAVTPPNNPVPSISGISPNQMAAGSPGFNLTLFGSNFLNGSTVRWNGADRPTTFLTSTQLRAAIPAADIAAAGGSNITVFNPAPGGGISNAQNLTITLPNPLICCLDPISALAGDPGFTLTVYGSNFVAGSAVFWNGAARPTEFVSTGELRAAIPSSDIATSGTAAVTVLNPAPGSGGALSPGRSFEIATLAPGAPRITSVSPKTILAGGPGFTLTVNGTGFIASSVVRWNGQNRPTSFDSSSQLRAEIPASDIAAGSTFGVTVSNQSAASSALNEQDPEAATSTVVTTIALNPVPYIEGFSPASAVLGRPSFALLVDGDGFIGGSKMKWNGTERATNVANNTRLTGEITGTDIALMRTGVVTVTNSGPGGGEVSKEFTIETNTPAAATLYYPRLVTKRGTGPDDTEVTGIAIANLGAAEMELTIRAFDREGIEIRGEKITNPLSLKLPPLEQRAIIDFQLFGKDLAAQSPVGWIKLESTGKKLVGFFLAFDDSVSVIDGADVSSNTLTSFVLPEIEDLGFTQIHVPNPDTVPATITFELYKSDGTLRTGPVVRQVNSNGAVGEFFTDLFPGVTPAGSDYIRASSTRGVVPFEYLGRTALYVAGLNGQDANAGATTLYCPQYVTGGGFRSSLSVVNLDSTSGTVTFDLFSDDGTLIGSRVQTIPAKGKIYITDQDFFVAAGDDLMQGFVKITSSGPKLAGAVVFGDPEREAFSSALPLVSVLLNSFVFGQVASDDRYYTGIAIVNPNDTVASAAIEVFDSRGTRIQSKTESIQAKGRKSRLLTQYFPALENQKITSGYIKVTVDKGVASFAVFGTNNLSSLSAVPPQVVP